MKSADIVIVGSGSLAGAVVNALSQVSAGRLRTAVIGRSADKVSQLVQLANARAAILGTPATFSPLAVERFSALALSRAVRTLKPKLIFHAASIQSPWERTQGQNGWTKLLASAGFGATLPLQLALAAETSRGAEDSEAPIINASYPDCVNIVLHRLGLRTTCGIGNAAIVEAFCRSHKKVSDVRVVAHHGHLRVWLKGKRGRSQPRVWVDGREVDSRALRPNLGPIEDELNHVTASTALAVMLALLEGRTLRASVPGVAGLPGGYPFESKGGKFKMQLPRGITLAEAIAHNKQGERLDGLDVESSAKFVGKARQALASVGFEYAEGFELAEWSSVRDKMILLRDRLRSTTA